jgi:hypothetical protein
MWKREMNDEVPAGGRENKFSSPLAGLRFIYEKKSGAWDPVRPPRRSGRRVPLYDQEPSTADLTTIPPSVAWSAPGAGET